MTGDAKIRIFLPLCGKAGDLNWLYQAGHTVLGVEGVPFVVEQFFRENKIEHEKTSMQDINGWKFKVGWRKVLLNIKAPHPVPRKTLRIFSISVNQVILFSGNFRNKKLFCSLVELRILKSNFCFYLFRVKTVDWPSMLAISSSWPQLSLAPSTPCTTVGHWRLCPPTTGLTMSGSCSPL